MIRSTWLVAFVGLLFLAGCGPAPKPTGQLQGSVTFEGAPVKDAKVQLQSPTTGESFATKVDADGKFAFDRAVTAGEYKVVVLPSFDMPPPGPGAAPPPKPGERKDIPERYRAMDKTDLKVEVKPGSNTYDAKLTK